MSRVGRKPVPVPKGVNVNLSGRNVAIKGPKGELKRELPLGVSVKVEGGNLQVGRDDDSRENRAKHGLTRALLNNMVVGVTQGFERQLEINGVGYKAELKGQKVVLSLGFSHPVEYTLPEGITAKVDKNLLILSGIDRQALGAATAKIRSLRPPEPYKGKGIKYDYETIRRKEGKKK